MQNFRYTSVAARNRVAAGKQPVGVLSLLLSNSFVSFVGFVI